MQRTVPLTAVSQTDPAGVLCAASRLRFRLATVCLACAFGALGCGTRDDGQKLRAELQRIQARLQKIENATSARKAHLAGLEAAFVKLRDGLGAKAAGSTPAPATPARMTDPDALGAETEMREGAFLEGFLILVAEQERTTATMVEQWEELNAFMQTLIGEDVPEELRRAANQLAANTARRVRELARRQQALSESFRTLVDQETDWR